MAFCPNCGKEVANGQLFCAGCGTAQPRDTTYTNQSYGPPPPPPDPEAPLDYQRDVQENKVFGIISYIWFLSLVSYFAAPKNSRFSRFHAIQGLNLFILELIVSVIGAILRAIFSWIWPVARIMSMVTGICSLGLVALMIIGIISAANGEMKELPVVGSIKFVKH